MTSKVEPASIELHPRFLVDAKGRKTAAVIDIRTYKKLLEYLEDAEDILRIGALARRGAKFRPYAQVSVELKGPKR
jgi:hypothetical protein